MADNNSTQSIFFELSDKKIADELKKDIISYGVPSDAVNLKKVRGKDAYKLTVNDGMKHIMKVINVLHGPEYALDFKEIENLLGIKIEF